MQNSLILIMDATINNVEDDIIPDEMNPYEILGISPKDRPDKTKKAFRRLITSENMHMRKMAALAYDMISSKYYIEKYPECYNHYEIKGNIFKVINKNHFYYTNIGDLENLKKLYENDKSILKEKDCNERSLLYIAARNGFIDICRFLLEEGMDPNEVQSNESTPSHGAAFYNQYDTVKVLISYGAKICLKNLFGKSVLEDAHKLKIKDILSKCENDKIICLFNKLMDAKIAKKLILVKYNDLIIGKKILRSDELMPKDIDINEIKKDWEVGWHGTKFEFLESIMKYGLYPSGSKLENGYEIKPLKGHVQLKQKLAGFDDWAKAIFVSPSIFYAGHPAYARKIISDADNEEYSVLIETRIRPGSYSKHPPTVVKYAQKNGEPTFVEYRIEVKDESNLIMRIESKNNVIVTGILFAKTEFLKNIKDYYKGDIFVNSKEEHNLFLTQN